MNVFTRAAPATLVTIEGRLSENPEALIDARISSNVTRATVYAISLGLNLKAQSLQTRNEGHILLPVLEAVDVKVWEVFVLWQFPGAVDLE
jgi:hypothetical protein